MNLNNEIKTVKKLWSLLDGEIDFYYKLFETKSGMVKVNLPQNDIKVLLEALDDIINKLNDDRFIGPSTNLKKLRVKDLFVTEQIINTRDTVNQDCKLLLFRLLYIVEYHSLTRYSSGSTRIIRPYVKLANLLLDIF